MLLDTPLVINDFSKNYRGVAAVENLNLRVHREEIFGFLGPNGAGKTTTIRAILNFIIPSKGSISIFGKDSVEDSVDLKNHIGYLPGDISLYNAMNGNHFLRYMSSLGRKADWAYVKELSAKLEISLNRKIGDLSKGNKQKIGLIQAFMHKPNLLILDEPTSGLDPLMKRVFYEIVQEMKSLGKTIFISSHDLTEVQRLCDRAGFIRDGKLIATENLREISNLNLRRYTITFESPKKVTQFNKLKNVSDISVDGNELTVTISGSVRELIDELSRYDPTDLFEHETSLEDLFMRYY